MKDAYYFPHDCNARNDQKIIGVRSVFGMRGYGIYFGIIEIMREAKVWQIPSKYNLLAFDLREEEKDIKSVVEDFGLFDLKNGMIISKSLERRMSHLTQVREKRQLAGKEGGLAKARVLLQQKPSKSVAVKESKVKESKVYTPGPTEPVKKPYGEFVLLTDVQYDKLMDRLGQEEAVKVIKRLNNYIGSKGKKYKSHYHTILNWIDMETKKHEPILVND